MDKALEHWIGETWIALVDAGMVHDKMTGSSADFEREVKEILGEMFLHYAQDAQNEE